MGRGLLLLGFCVAVAGSLVVSACGAAESGPPAQAPPASVSQAPPESPPAPGEEAGGGATAGVEDPGRPEVPVLSGFTLDGAPISTGDFLGAPFVVKVFAEY